MSNEIAQAAVDRATGADGDLVLVYQPIHEARTRKIYAVEALLRQRRANGELREASIITKTVEKGPAAELFHFDSMLVRKAYDDAAQWQKRGADVRLNINLSPREFQEGHVVTRLTELVTGCGIDTHLINLEITETSYIKEPEETVHALEELKKLGLELWLDDFGTGHSSLTHLQHFPLDGLKLPGAFVRGIAVEERCRAITRALIQLAHDLGLRVIAEEIETEEQLEFLLEHGCDYIQGFLFSKPMEIEELSTALRGTVLSDLL
jgi:EAL domain-containing protein (putative c-di-GMP-specific phosphodiesterase class I)